MTVRVSRTDARVDQSMISRLGKGLTEMRIFVLLGLPRIQLQLFDSFTGTGPGAGTFTAFAANTVLASTDIVGLTPDPTERVITTDRPTGPGIDLPADEIARDAISSNACGVYGEVAKDRCNDERQRAY